MEEWADYSASPHRTGRCNRDPAVGRRRCLTPETGRMARVLSQSSNVEERKRLAHYRRHSDGAR